MRVFGLRMAAVKAQERPVWPIDAWGRHLATYQSEGSVRLYTGHVRRFSGRHPDPWAVQRRDVERHISALHAPEYQKSVLTALRAFYGWALDEGMASADPTRGVRGQRIEPREGRPCDPALLERAIRETQDPDVVLMLRICSETGLRRAEVARLHSDDVSSDGRWLTVIGKGSKQRKVPLSVELHGDLLARGRGWIFPGRFDGPITPGAAGRKMARALGDNPHSLRHRAATDVFDETNNLILVQRILGHASVATTQRYLGRVDDRMWDEWGGAIRRAVRARRLRAVPDGD